MATSEEISRAAEDAARDWLKEVDPTIANWRLITPENLGIVRDSWVDDASADIIDRFNETPGMTPVEMSDAQRADYYSETLLDFSVAIADRAQGVS